jgi:ATP-binding cassette subfamily B protein
MTDDLAATIEAFTKQSKLFEFLDPPGRKRMMDISQRMAFQPGQVVVTEGEMGDSFYVITQGAVSVMVDDFGTPRQVATLGRGSFFGEMAVVTNQPRSATVTALAPLEVLRFDKAQVEEVLRGYPRVREILAKMGVKRSEDTLEKMMAFSDSPDPDITTS